MNTQVNNFQFYLHLGQIQTSPYSIIKRITNEKLLLEFDKLMLIICKALWLDQKLQQIGDMDEDLFISVFGSLSPEAISHLSLKPIQAECVFTQEPDCEDDEQFVPAPHPYVLQIRDNYLVECEPKSRKIYGGFLMTLDYKFEVKRFAYDPESDFGKPYALVFYLPQRYEDQQQQIAIKVGVGLEGADDLQKFAMCLEQKIIFQMDLHNNFKVMERLFYSTTAALYSAIRLKDRKELVVKCIRKDLFKMTGRDMRKGIERQYAIPHQMPHENICKYYGVYESESSIYIIMEKLQVNLLQFLQMRLVKSEEQLKRILRKIFVSVAVLHENHVMHRDIKPENIMMRKIDDERYEPVLIDFGLAEYQEKQPFVFARCGTPGYTAPEIANSSPDRPYNRSCDIFSLGCILHFILIGRPLFEGNCIMQVIQKNKCCNINQEDPKYSKLGDKEKELLFRMLQKKPQNRITIQEILAHECFKLEAVKAKKDSLNRSQNKQQQELGDNSNSQTNSNANLRNQP